MEYRVENISIPLKGRTTERTIAHIVRIITENYTSVQPLADSLKSASRLQTFKNIWNYVRKNVRYQNDDKGIEELRRPLRTLSDGKGDCDDMSILISSLLLCLGIEPTLNIADYVNDGKTAYQHIYTSARDESGRRYVLDTVPEIPYFNYEESPISELKTITMKIEELAGIQDDISVLALNEMSDPDQLIKGLNAVTDEDIEEWLLGNVEIVSEEEDHDFVLTGTDRNKFVDNTLKTQLQFARHGILKEMENPNGFSRMTNLDNELELVDAIIESFDDRIARNAAIKEAIEKSIYVNFYKTFAAAQADADLQLSNTEEPIYLYVAPDSTVGSIEDHLEMMETDYEDEIGAFGGKAKRQERKEKRKEKRAKRKEEGKGFFNKIWQGLKKFNPAVAPMRLAFLKLIGMNFSGWGEKLAKAYKENDQDLIQKVEKKWKNFGGDVDNLKKAVYKSPKAKQFKGIDESEMGDIWGAIIKAAGKIFSGIGDLLGGKKKAGDKAGDKAGANIDITISPNGKDNDSDLNNNEKENEMPDTEKKPGGDQPGFIAKVKDFAINYKWWLIISVVGIIIIIAVVWWTKASKKKKQHQLRGLKAARTRKHNQLKGYVGTEKKTGSHVTRVVYKNKKPSSVSQSAGGGTQTRLFAGNGKKSRGSHFIKMIALAKRIRRDHPKMKWQAAVKSAANQLNH